MKRSDPAATLAKKRQVWVERTAAALAISNEEAADVLRTPRQQSIRINSLKSAVGHLDTENQPDWLGPAYDFMPEGRHLLVPVSEIRDAPEVQNGALFIQNAASWLPVLALDPKSGETILDVCAAPGGKTSHIAAITNNQAHIIANDNSRPRLAKLRVNMERLGAKAQYTLFEATTLARKLEGQQFDRILIDAPCSGEGLMNLNNDKDFATWSVAHIKRLQQLQKRIIGQAWQLLRSGGTLVYSTCTMAPEENEAVIDYLLRTHQDAHVKPFHFTLSNRVPALTQWNHKQFSAELQGCMRLKPSPDIEAFFVCRIKKLTED